MKEYSHEIKEFKGLKPYTRIPRNNPQLLDECYNVRVWESGLEPYAGITQPFVGMPTLAHPFPQFVPTDDGLFLATGTNIYAVESTYNLTSVLSGVTGTKQWHVADFGLYQVWTNGVWTVVRDYGRNFAIQPMPFNVSSVCNFRGQLIAGGMGTEGHNFVAWSRIGQIGDLTKILQPEDITNSAGFMPMKGSVLAVRAMADRVIVLTTDEVVALIPIGNTFGKKVLEHTGVATRDCVGGDIDEIIYVDVNGRVCRVREGKGIEVLWYDEYMANLTVSGIVIAHDDALKDFFISDGVRCYMLAPGGMSEVYELPTSLGRVSGILTGVRGIGSDMSGYITTSMFDFGLEGVKLISGVDIGIEGTDMTLSVGYRHGTIGAFSYSAEIPFSPQGVATPIVTGNQFKLKVESTDYTTFQPDMITVRWKLVDKRGIRGLYNAGT